MAKVTSKYQVTVPRKIAEEYHIRPGDDIDWVPAGEAIRVVPSAKKETPQSRLAARRRQQEKQLRLRWFDQATERHRNRPPQPGPERSRSRGWQREDLYGRGRSR